MQFLIAFAAGFLIPMLVAVSAFAGDVSVPKMGDASKKQPGLISNETGSKPKLMPLKNSARKG
ncbi:MAG: hypothetical protein AAF748_16950 [Pseudomonadota bacterium]